MGGEVDVQSVLGKGTTFSVKLSCKIVNTSSENVPSDAKEERKSSGVLNLSSQDKE